MSILFGILGFFGGGSIIVLVFKSLGISLNYIFPVLIAIPLLWYLVPVLLGSLFSQHENNKWNDHFDNSDGYSSILNAIAEMQPSQIRLLWRDPAPQPAKNSPSYIPCLTMYDDHHRELMRVRWPDRHSDNLRESMKRFPDWLNRNLDPDIAYSTQEIIGCSVDLSSYTLTQNVLGHYSINRDSADPVQYGILLSRTSS